MRITGYATVNMICSLTELEARKAQGSKQALQAREPRSTRRKDGTAMYGLARYVQKFVMCRKCNSPMRLVQSRKSGNAYLRCSSPSCKAIEYLDENDVNDYFLYAKVTCPQCKSKLTARLGSRGIYIRCRNGHSVKPNEI